MNLLSKPRYSRLLISLLCVALFGSVIGLITFQLSFLSGAIPIHAIFALGIMPLIFSAMTWFTPVLTRTAAPGYPALAPPLLALTAGLILLYSLQFNYSIHSVSAVFALLGTILLSRWIWRRRRQTIGTPHPGLLWYRLALAALGLGLIAILFGRAWPQYWIPLKRVHLHLNTLGFVGLTALGTLRVLLPTVGRFQDDSAAAWLHSQWKWLVSGTLLIAAGSAVSKELALLGAILWIPPVATLVAHPLRTHRRKLFTLHGASPALAGSIGGSLLMLAGGVSHTFFPLPAAAAIQVFVWAFLFPLVTGAATHLLPLWLYPDNQRAAAELARHMESLGGVRALLFLLAGIIALSRVEWSWAFAGVALLQFLIATARGIFLPGNR
ncbi:MAG: hypothetical protein KDI74_02460 [Gammaproteobacteria bacterium]|nr:hypothetical protein [Gammaproteobacteria bacterium]